MIASLERIDISSKERLFDALFQLASSTKSHTFGSALGWALERLFARVPLCGELDVVVPAAVAEGWAVRILEGKNLKMSSQELHAILLSVGAKTGDSRRDVSPDLKDVIVKRLRSTGVPSASVDGLQHVIELEYKQVSRLLGDNIPAGLVLA